MTKKLLLILTLILAAILRAYNNTAVSLWHDEAFSALYISKYGWGEMMHRIILDVHPPLYYLVLRVWGYVFGHSLISLRGLSIILGVLTVWAGYLLMKQLFKKDKIALFGALLLAINPFQIQYALEARMYTLGTFLLLISSYLLAKALETSGKKYWIWYGVTVAACAYTHYFLFFSLAAHGVYLLYYLFATKRWQMFKARDLYYGIGAYVLSVILYLPWVPSLLEQTSRVGGGYWIPKPDKWAIPGTIWKMVFGGEGTNRRSLVIASFVTAAILVYFIAKVKERQKWMVFLSLVVPFLASLALSYKSAIYLDRYFVFTSMFFSLLIAAAIMQIQSFAARRTIAVIFVAVSIVAFFKNWQSLDVKNLFTNRAVNKKPGMAKASQVINEQAQGNNKIFVGSSFIFFTYQYYNETGIKPLLLSDRPVEDIPHFAGTAILTNDDLQITENGLVPASAVAKNDNVWLVWTTGFGGSKPNVPGNWSIVNETSFEDTPGFKGKIVVTQYHVR